MSDVATKEDLRDFREEVRIGIQDIKDRQDRTNGRILAAEEHDRELAKQLAEHGEQMARISENLKGLNKEVYERPRAQTPQDLVASQEILQVLRTLASPDNQPALTNRDVRVLSGAGKAAWAIIGAVAPVVFMLLKEWWGR